MSRTTREKRMVLQGELDGTPRSLERAYLSKGGTSVISEGGNKSPAGGDLM